MSSWFKCLKIKQAYEKSFVCMVICLQGFQNHESKSEIHKTAMLGKHNFLDTLENKQKYIDLIDNKTYTGREN